MWIDGDEYVSDDELFTFNKKSNLITTYGYSDDSYIKFIKEIAIVEYLKILNAYPMILEILNDSRLEYIDNGGCYFESNLSIIGDPDIVSAYNFIKTNNGVYPFPEVERFLKELTEITNCQDLIDHKNEFIKNNKITKDSHVIQKGDTLYVPNKKGYEKFLVDDIKITDKIILEGKWLDRSKKDITPINLPGRVVYFNESELLKTISKKSDTEKEIEELQKKLNVLKKKKSKV